MSKVAPKKSLEIKISTIPAVSVILRENELNAIRSAMHETTGGADDYFDNDLAIIDLAELNGMDDSIDWPELLDMLRSHRLHPVAVRGAPAGMEADIRMHGLNLDLVAKPRPSPAPEKDTAASSEEIATVPSKSMIIDAPVRAGQRVYARDADLIVMAAVNSGAEIIADGSIHVYAPLRGRALAGARGDASARIFTLGMEAELVSIAGIYNTFENGFSASSIGRPVQIRLIGDRIDVSPVNSETRY